VSKKEEKDYTVPKHGLLVYHHEKLVYANLEKDLNIFKVGSI
jgi:hypothetical protein